MQYEIDRDSSMLEQIMPEADEKMELVEGIPRKEDEKYDLSPSFAVSFFLFSFFSLSLFPQKETPSFLLIIFPSSL